MWKRVVIALIIAGMPAIAAAENELTPTGSTGTSLQQQAPSPSNNAGSSNADSTALQPAGNAPLQSDGAASNGLGASTGDPLQGPAPNDQQLKVYLNGEADTASDPTHGGLSTIDWLGLFIGLTALIGGLVWLWRQYRRPRPAVIADTTTAEDAQSADDAKDPKNAEVEPKSSGSPKPDAESEAKQDSDKN